MVGRSHPPRALIQSGSLWLALLLGLFVWGGAVYSVEAEGNRQQSTPQSTGSVTPSIMVIVTADRANVRLGPGLNFDLIGVMIAGQRAPAIGRSPGQEWIQIAYPGVPGNVAWVYAHLVTLEGSGQPPIVEPPPTPTPRITATIDPTLAAQFNILELTPTRLPTFTPAQPVAVSTFEIPSQAEPGGGLPPILAILGLMVMGLFGMMVSLLRGS